MENEPSGGINPSATRCLEGQQTNLSENSKSATHGQSLPLRAGRQLVRITGPNFDPTEYQMVELDDDDDDDNDDDSVDEPDGDLSYFAAERAPRPTRTSARAQANAALKAVKDDEDLSKALGKLRVQPALIGVAKTFLSGLKQDKARVRVAVDQFPRISGMEDVKRLLPLAPISEIWTAWDQKREIDRCKKEFSSETKRQRLLDVGGNTDILALYKTSLRLFERFPEEIISEENNLQYHHQFHNRQTKNGYENPAWTAPFCKLFKDRMLHGMFMGSPMLLVTAIQYVIKVETQDWTSWSIEKKKTGDMFLQNLQTLSREHPGQSLPELRIMALQRVFPTGGGESPWNILFASIENTIRPERGAIEWEPSELYKVEYKHLEILETALDRMGFAGSPMFRPTKMQPKMVTASRTTRDFPQWENIMELREYMILREREKVNMKKKTADVAEAAEGADAESESESVESERETPETSSPKRHEDVSAGGKSGEASQRRVNFPPGNDEEGTIDKNQDNIDAATPSDQAILPGEVGDDDPFRIESDDDELPPPPVLRRTTE